MHLVLALEPVESPPHPLTLNENRAWECQGASHAHSPASLFPSPGSNQLDNGISSDQALQANEVGRNTSHAQLPADGQSSADRPQDGRYVQQVLFEIKASQEARQAAVRLTGAQQQQLKRQAAVTRHIARMQQFLDSRDPILMAEAIAWAQVNPGVLDLRSASLESDAAHN